MKTGRHMQPQNRQEEFTSKAGKSAKAKAPAGYVPDLTAECENWRRDRQPMELGDFSTHRYVNQLLIPAYLEKMADIAITAGYATPAQKTELVRGMLHATGYEDEKHTRKKEFKIGNIAFYWRLKDPSACEGKIIDSLKEGKLKDEQNIGDYFAGKFICETIDDVVRIRAASRNHDMTSRKCEYSHPSSEGFRSHKSHHEVTTRIPVVSLVEPYRDAITSLYPADADGMVTISARGELMNIDRPGEQIEVFTHHLKDAQRSLEQASLSFSMAFSHGAGPAISANLRSDTSTLPDRMQKWASQIASVRTFCNDYIYHKNGFDVLTAPGKERGEPSRPDYAIAARMRTNILAIRSGIPPVLAEPLGGLFGKLAVTKATAANGNNFSDPGAALK